mmetsp:Transcript_39810/g.100963  ORF Transcript_39810/g.100963 Transcript_39810/m.100963 type:complete len:623 (-) Transcript_39810:96-1964(-)
MLVRLALRSVTTMATPSLAAARAFPTATAAPPAFARLAAAHPPARAAPPLPLRARGVRCAATLSDVDSAASSSSSAPLAARREMKPFAKKTKVRELKEAGEGAVGRTVELKGWCKTVRDQKQFAFMEVTDGSSLNGLQVVLKPETQGWELLQDGAFATGASVVARGEIVASPGGKQATELQAASVELVGGCGGDYPLQKKKHSLEFLREIAHLRPRSNTIGAVARVRSALAFATHEFFTGNGFQYVHTPLISASDCEGAGEMFQVTTLLNEVNRAAATPKPTEEEMAALKAEASAKGSAVKAAKEAGDKAAVAAALAELMAAKSRVAAAEEAAALSGELPRREDGSVDCSQDFFGEAAYLTVSGQLNGEMYACALSDIYTFGPTFRAENSNTSRHLAEFWMIEPEIAFCTLEDDMQCAEDYVRYCCKYLLANCMPDLEFIVKMIDPTAIERLQQVAETPFERVSYTEAVEILQTAIKEKKKKFQYKVEWGTDLQSEHERYLTEEVFMKPTIVYNYPKEIKAFYMRLNDDNKTVAAMDVLVPKVGELIGGSQREERLDVLLARLKESGMDEETYWWYIELRKYGSVPHSGFGLGFERLILFATGIENIREVIPFPRWPGHAAF